MQLMDGEFSIDRKEEASDVGGNAEDGGLLGQGIVIGAGGLRNGRHEHTRDREEEVGVR